MPTSGRPDMTSAKQAYIVLCISCKERMALETQAPLGHAES